MFRKFSRFWNKHGFNVLVIGTIIFFALYWLFITRHRDRGSYSTSYYYPPPETNQNGLRVRNDNHAQWRKEDPYGSRPKKRPRVTQSSRGEETCRRYLEHIFERPFQKCRPPFLYNTVTSENLELDMYNSDLKLAVEYHGRQHYEYVPFLHNHSRINFQNQKYRDEKKIDLCRQNGVTLIVVPYTVPLERIPSFLQQEIRRLRIPNVQKW